MKECKTCRILYIALMELMAAEGGEPGNFLDQKVAWRRAEEAIQRYKEELDNGRLGKPHSEKEL